MKKPLLLLILLFMGLYSLIAQDTTLFNYDYYDFKYNTKTRDMHITGTDREVNAKYHISMGTIPKGYIPVRIVIGDDSLTVVYFHNHKKICSLYTQSFSKVDLQPNWNVNLALSIDSKKGSYYYHVVTPDGNKCALAFWYHKKKNPYRLKTVVINGDGKKLYGYEYESDSRHGHNLTSYGLKDGAFYFVPELNMYELYLLDSSGINYYSSQYLSSLELPDSKALILPNNDYLAIVCTKQIKAINHFDYQKKQFICISENLSEQEQLKSSFSMMHKSNSPKQEGQKLSLVGFYEFTDHSSIIVYQATGKSYKEETVTSTWKDKEGKTHTTTSTKNVNYTYYCGDILIEQISPDFKFTNYYIIESFMWSTLGEYLASVKLKDNEILLTYGLHNDECIIRKNTEGGLDIIKVDPDAAPTPEEESEKFKTMDESPEFDD